jgi:hypothetical protein
VHRNILPWTSSFSHSCVWIMQQRIPQISPKRARSLFSPSLALNFLLSFYLLRLCFMKTFLIFFSFIPPAVINSSASRNSWEKPMLMNETDLSLASFLHTHLFRSNLNCSQCCFVFLLCIAFIDILLSDLSTRNVNYKVSKRENMQKRKKKISCNIIIIARWN